MKPAEIKTELHKVIDTFPEDSLQDLLDFLNELQGQSPAKARLSNNLRQILAEDKELLEKLAK